MNPNTNRSPFSGRPEGPRVSIFTASPCGPAAKMGKRGFTLIELLVVVGIVTVLIALAIPAILISRKRGVDIRIKSDLTLIAQALDAYKADFGTYPALADPITISQETGNNQWLDYSQERGAVLLCMALLGPGPADSANNQSFTPGDDGADGPGFRVRRNYVATASGGTTIAGKVYGPYIDASKFKVQYLNPFNTAYPNAYPALFEGTCGDWTEPATGKQFSGSPILYYPAAPGNPVKALDYVPANIAGPSVSQPRFNGFDNDALLSAYNGGNPTGSSFEQLAVNVGALPYMLWTAGQDGVFGMVPGSPTTGQPATGKSDDITNFDLPGNLKK